MKKLPLNIQSFLKMRGNDYIYVDKTDLIYRLAQGENYYFLSRPRRFGKSLLCDIVKYYFMGRRDLFVELKMEQLETEWKQYPVMHLDFNPRNYSEDISVLQRIIEVAINELAEQYGVTLNGTSNGERFGEMLKKVHEATKMPVVLIFDEYDKPLLETMDQPELHEQTRKVLRPFYGNLKTASDHIRFALLTGVTKFSRLSIFSDLNNVTDITLSDDYSTLLGITEEELHDYFDEYVDSLATKNGKTKEQAYEWLHKLYDGYHFAKHSAGVYNPYSIINCFNDKEFARYWGMTGVPYHLVKLLRAKEYDLSTLQSDVIADRETLETVETDNTPIGMMYQSGYLTIKGFDEDMEFYRLGFPNEEVRYSFLRLILPDFLNKDQIVYNEQYRQIKLAALAGEVDAMMEHIRRLIAGVPCETTDPRLLELHYRNMMFLIMAPLGFDVQCECAVLAGVIDMVVKTKKIVYVFEFKRGDALKQGADQIVRKDYAAQWIGGDRKVIALAVAFDNDTRNISKWTIVNLNHE